MWDGKRSRRMKMPRQLRLFDSLSEMVATMAHESRRTVGLQLVYLIEQGIEHETRCPRKATLRTKCHPRGRASETEKVV